MSKDHVDLICNIAELAGLFEKSTSLQDFLKATVNIVADHMKAEVASIYLFDNQENKLTLRATRGLELNANQSVSLTLGEGITGLALKELRPICVERGKHHPNFKLFPDLNEESFEAFLAVPILRGIERLGVIVVQHITPGYFDDHDITALRAIAAQLANTIESVQLLLSIQNATAISSNDNDVAMPAFFKGKCASAGVALGKAAIIDAPNIDNLLEEADLTSSHTMDDFNQTLVLTEAQLEELQQKLEKDMSDVAALIFSAHLLFLKDDKFSGTIRSNIRQGMTPRNAIVNVVNHYIQVFSKSSNLRLREKVHDIKDLGHRLLHNLSEPASKTSDYRGHIIIASEILPSDMLRLGAQNVEGIVLLGSGVTAHVSILARSTRTPMIIIDDSHILKIRENTSMLMDAEQGMLYIEPKKDVIAEYHKLEQSQKEAMRIASMHEQTQTTDKVRIRLFANVNLLSDVKMASRLKAEGIGLYRSEFPFIVRNDFPSEEEQYLIYRKIVDLMPEREITFRTLDIGGDKMLSYYAHVDESNPFLGLRAIRFSLRNKDIFSDQLRAMLRAGLDATVRIMFPLISSVDDFLEAREVVRECQDDLSRKDIPFGENVALGVMIELPSAVEIAEDLAQEADFLSIGTNDLIQYLLAVDRTNEQVSSFYLAHHPAVLRSIAKVAAAGEKYGKDVSICGDLAADNEFIPFILGVGIRKLSVNSYALPKVQNTIESVNLVEAQQLAREVLNMGRVSQIAEYLHANIRTPHHE